VWQSAPLSALQGGFFVPLVIQIEYVGAIIDRPAAPSCELAETHCKYEMSFCTGGH
jgi:hypothetical protein